MSDRIKHFSFDAQIDVDDMDSENAAMALILEAMNGADIACSLYAPGSLNKAAPPADELARLEQKLATIRAKNNLMSYPITILEVNGVEWMRLTEPNEEEWRYLELRGLLEQHPDNPNLVRIKED